MHDSAMAIATAAYRRFAALAEDADPNAPTGLADWRVADLIDHVVWGASMEAAAVRTAAGLPPMTVADSLGGAISAFTESATLDLAPDAILRLAAGSVTWSFAAPLFAFEAALHTHDLAHALGTATELTPSELAACTVVLGPMLDLIAGPTPEVGVRIDLIGLGSGIRLTATVDGWQRDVPTHDAATTIITGSPAQIVLFASGRAAPDAVQVSGERTHAEAFKTYFPGP